MSIGRCNVEGYTDPTPYHALTSVCRDEKRRDSYKKLIFVSSPFAGDVERNIENARKFSRMVVDNGAIPITPHLLFPQFLDDNNHEERTLGINFGLRLLVKCDEIWVFGRTITQGMRVELAVAKRKRVKVRYFDENGTEDRLCRS